MTPELLYIGAMFHDIGGSSRGIAASTAVLFDVDGANAARDFLREHGVSGDALRTVWDAIALPVRAPRTSARSSAAPSTAPHSAAAAPKRERSRVAIRRSGTVFDAPRA